ncbi:hypothetical protein BBOV_I002100 [Babesia bovis T2Bo]|uniref:hypothetical protein n=1 Tax=Babesia bovis T2Bo TaxID=484906 RepID=UPI001C368895|nr:hypothetical protein BBOV_I002100 [Babesia bovis T2Bo]EDO05293.2 hypothetical protein BBOV_I002100 [Babesia bovis T2Bo]
MFNTHREQSLEDQVKSSFKTKAKMFLFTIALSKVVDLSLQLVSCYKGHQCPGPAEKASTEDKSMGDLYVTLDSTDIKLSEAQISTLRGDPQLRASLANGSLRDVLKTIAISEDPISTMAPYMGDATFSGFVNNVLALLDCVDQTNHLD